MLANFFRPNSIAVIGASANPKKIGFSILKNLIDGEYPGKIYPVNLKEESILGLKAFASVTAIKKKVEVAIIAVKADVVPAVIEECAKEGVSFAVIITSGFAETGGEGLRRQEEILAIAGKAGLRILGPNCLGIISPVNRLNASFATNMPERKNIGVISQSGATCTAILDWANKKGIGFSHFVSLGNKSDLTENDFLEYFIKDDKTEVVLGYLESISDGKEFLRLAKKLSKKKPFVLLKSGKSLAGAKAARSHTAALAGDDLVMSEALREAGVIRAETLEDLFEWTQNFGDLKLPKTNELLIITNAGGPGVMAVDALDTKSPLKLFEFNKKMRDEMAGDLPSRILITNPLDLQGDATSYEFERVFETVKKSGILKLVILTPQSNTDAEKIAREIAAFKDNLTVVALIGGERFKAATEVLSKARIPVFLYPERAVLALEKLVHYQDGKNAKRGNGRQVKGFRKAAAPNKEGMADAELAKLLAAYHIPYADSSLTTSAKEAIEAAEKIGYPVVLKISSPDILHKTECGAVKLGIQDEETLREAYQEILRNAKKCHPEARINGITVYGMVRSSVEVAIGAKRDPYFGPFVMFGLGGIYIQVFQDIQIRLAPVTVEEAKEMIREIKSYALLSGYRNGEKYDLEKLAEAISGLSQMMCDFKEISEIDVNPIRFKKDHKNILALDAKVIFDSREN